MDDLFSCPDERLHGGTIPAIKPTKRRARAGSTFRAAWDPVTTPDFGQLPSFNHGSSAAGLQVGGGAWAASSMDTGVAVLAPPARRRPSSICREIAQPVVDVATAVKRRAHVTSWDRLAQRGLEILPFALALTLISSLVWGAYWLPIPLVIMLLGFDIYWAWRSLNMGIHTVKGYRAMKAVAQHRLARRAIAPKP